VEAATAPGTLSVSSSVEAEVLVDGKVLGVAPLTRQLPPGRHQVVLHNRESGVRATFDTEVRQMAPASINWQPKRGRVDFRVLPYGEVFMRGRSLGVTPITPTLLEGTYTFKVSNAETGKSKEVTATVTGEQTTTVRVDLR
jgi:hypothetical protein